MLFKCKWTVNDDNIIYEKHENGDSLIVLFQENNKPKKLKIFQKESNTSTKNSFNIESFKSHQAKFVSRDNQDVDLCSMFPINNDEQLTSIESKIIQDEQFRNILIP